VFVLDRRVCAKDGRVCVSGLGLCKILFDFYSFVHESVVRSFFRRACIARTVAILLHGYWAVYDPPLDLPLVCHTPYNIGNNNIV